MNSPKRILHLSTTGHQIGGAERLLIDIARLTDPNRSRLHFAFIRPGSLVPEQLRRAGATASDLGYCGPASLAHVQLALQRLLFEFKPDVLHTHLLHAGLLGYLSTPFHRECGLKIVHSRHYDRSVLENAPRLAFLADKWVSPRFDRILAISESVRLHLIEEENVPEDRITLIENGVDNTHLAGLDKEEGRRALGNVGVPVDEGRLIVTSVANLVAYKGHSDLLRSWVRVRESLPLAELVLVGDGPEEPVLRDLARQLELESSVHFLGHRVNAAHFVSGSDVYVQPSHVEGFGLALVEAMAVGRAAVATAVGGMTSIVLDGITGLLVPPEDPHALARAIIVLGRDEQLRTEMGRAAARRAATEYSVEKMIAQVEGVYEQLLGTS